MNGLFHSFVLVLVLTTVPTATAPHQAAETARQPDNVLDRHDIAELLKEAGELRTTLLNRLIKEAGEGSEYRDLIPLQQALLKLQVAQENTELSLGRLGTAEKGFGGNLEEQRARLARAVGTLKEAIGGARAFAPAEGEER
jgi:hypothetical protein